MPGRSMTDYTKSGERSITIKIWLNNEVDSNNPHETVSCSQLQCVEGGWKTHGNASVFSTATNSHAGYAARGGNFISIYNSKLCRLQPGRQIQFIVGDSKIDGNVNLNAQTIGSICRLSD